MVAWPRPNNGAAPAQVECMQGPGYRACKAPETTGLAAHNRATSPKMRRQKFDAPYQSMHKTAGDYRHDIARTTDPRITRSSDTSLQGEHAH